MTLPDDAFEAGVRIAYVRKQIVEMMDEDDARTKAWDRMIAELVP